MELNKIYNMDVMEGLKQFPDKSIDCVVCSPPYWKLRDYKWNGQWGLEPTFHKYLDNLWKMMDEIYRILKDEGTVFINLADTYSTQGGQNRGKAYVYDKYKVENRELGTTLIKGDQGYPSKNLLLIPHRFAIGCMDRSWIVRNDIVWSSFNKMPESTRDRFARKKEYFFFFVKQSNYYFDLDSIRNKPTYIEKRKNRIVYNSNKEDSDNRTNTFLPGNPKGKNPGDVIDYWEDIIELDNMPEMFDVPTKASKDKHFAMYNEKLIEPLIKAGCPEGGVVLDPFAGSGTTPIVALKNNRKFVAIEGKKEYCEEMESKIEKVKENLKTDIFNLID